MLDRSREFIELAIQLNFTKAAERLHLSASALSRHISDLEAELGVTLFNRSPLSLTRAGEFYLESISAIIEDLDATIDQVRRISRAAESPFSIYVLPVQDSLHQVVYEAAALLRQEIPGLDTDICVDDRFSTTQEAILSGKADVGVVYERSLGTDPGIAHILLGKSPICVWVLKSSPLADYESLSFLDLAEYALPVSTNRQSLAGTDSVVGRFTEECINLKTHLKNIKDRAGYYLSLRPDEFMVDFAQDQKPLQVNPDLVQVPFNPPQYSALHLVYRRDGARPELPQYIEFCQQLVRQKGLL